MENLVQGRKRVIEDILLRGREIANQLRHVLNEGGDSIDYKNNYDRSTTTTINTTTPFAEELVKEVLMSFTNSLLVLNNPTSESLHHEVSDLQQLRDYSKSEDSQESNCKSSIVLHKEKRGCYKRRKTSQTWVKESEFPEEDGHQWRKYGQKVILNAKFPRNYYRCTHKFDQGCIASKQVQKIQEDPPLHKTTYTGHHTCRNLQNPEIIVDSVSPSESSKYLSFDNSFPALAKQDCPFLSSSSPAPSSSSVKRECKEEISPPPPSSNDHYHLTFDDTQKNVTLSSTLEDHSDHIGHVINPDHDLYYSELDDLCFARL